MDYEGGVGSGSRLQAVLMTNAHHRLKRTQIDSTVTSLKCQDF